MNFLKLILILFSTYLVSCSQRTEKNKILSLDTKYEWQQVLDHFKTDSCKEKLLAANFILEHIQEKYSIYSAGIDTIIKKSEWHLQERRKHDKTVKNKITRYIFKMKNEKVDLSKQQEYDTEVLDSDFVIKQVDSSYASWKKMLKVNVVSFDDYCEYILPYRVDNERISYGMGDILRKSYGWATDSLLSGSHIKVVLNQLIDSIDYKVEAPLKKNIACSFSALQAHKLRFGTCEDGVIYFVHIFRALGIPAALDYIPQWGSHHATGHSICAIKWHEEWIKINVGSVGDKFITKRTYSNHSVPKVYRKTYSNSEPNHFIDRFSVDVTNEYKPVTDLEMGFPVSMVFKNFIPALAIFNKYKGFRVISLGEKGVIKLRFNNLGTNNIYFPGIINSKGFSPLGYPVHIDTLSNKTVLKPNLEHETLVQLHRKYPYAIYRYPKKKDWLDNLKNCYVEGANNKSFNHADKLLTIGVVKQSFMNNYKINASCKYQYIRFKNDDSIWVSIAQIDFLNEEGKSIKGKPIFGKYFPKRSVNATDDNPLTYYTGKNNHYFGYEYNEPQYITSINFQPRNDGNHIEISNEYELMYWNNGWVSLGRQMAKDHYLEFERVPQNALLWLKNITTGSEELPFVIDVEGRQYWAGSMPI